MSFVDELERAIKNPATVRNTHWFATHGPRLLAAVRLAEVFNKMHTSGHTLADLPGLRKELNDAFAAYRATAVSEPK